MKRKCQFLFDQLANFQSYTHGLKGIKRDLYGSYLTMLKCVTQKVSIEMSLLKVLYLRPLRALIETYTVTKQDPVKV